MRTRDIAIWFFCIFLAAALIIAAGKQLNFINSQRYEMKLIANEPLENAPPSLAFATVAMGAFRGLLVDILWMRADRLKDQGQFFDAKQLAEWITTLQPRFPSVWEFNAWNMAYNISVCLPATFPEQRWHWVRNGYELLRDQGIPLNPKSILLYRELARIFQHKIGGVSDDAHKYYKLQLATAMEPLLGPADNQYFEALAAAPAEWNQITKDASIVSLVNALKSADKAFADDKNFVSNYLALRQDPAKFNPEAFTVIDDFRGTEALKKFDIFARAYELRNTWKLEPALMQQLNETYGPVDWDEPNKHTPLDWRHPDCHAIYWAVRGLQLAGKNVYSIDETNTDRIVGHSLNNLFRNGKTFTWDITDLESSPGYQQQQQLTPRPPHQNLLIPSQRYATEPPKKEIFLRPDLRMFEPYNKSLMAVLEKYKVLADRTYISLQNGHRHMLENAVLSFYQAGHIKQAQKIYKQLGQLYPRDEFKIPLHTFAKNRLHEELSRLGLNDARENVQMLLREAYFRYAMRDDDEAFGREKMARELYDRYQSMYSDQNRINLPDFKLLRYFALVDFYNDRQYPPDLRSALLARIKIERPELAERLMELEQQQLQKHAEQSQ